MSETPSKYQKSKCGNVPPARAKISSKISKSVISAGILVESKDPKEVQKEIDEGKYDAEIKEERTEVPADKLKELQSEQSRLAEEAAAAAPKKEEEAPAEGEEKPEEDKETEKKKK